MRHAFYRLKALYWDIRDSIQCKRNVVRLRRELRESHRWYARAQQMYEEHAGRLSMPYCMQATRGKR